MEKQLNISFYITNSNLNGFLHYWNNKLHWVDDFDQATPFPIDILVAPIPQGTTAILGIDDDSGDVILEHHPIPLPHRDQEDQEF